LSKFADVTTACAVCNFGGRSRQHIGSTDAAPAEAPDRRWRPICRRAPKKDGSQARRINGRQQVTFGIVAESEWRLENIESVRKDRLLRTPFKTILDAVTREATPSCWNIEPIRRFPSHCLAVINLLLPSQTVDLFHNGAGGYRAQYYLDIDLGEKANRCAIDSLVPRLRHLYADAQERPWPWERLETSLMHWDAKIWIHEGRWINDTPATRRNLAVERWRSNKSPHIMKRFEASAELTPEDQNCLGLKGGCLDGNGAQGNIPLKPCRSRDIHELGFT
jgi:hypothetical protein